ncbi:hypothetical protein JCM10295v2_003249 [Rhodotorula toruloides]
MSAFMQPPPSPRKRKNSTASNASSRASSVSRLGDTSDSEEEGGRTFDRRRYAAQIRLDALACLRTLASTNPKALYKHWGLFLAESPYLRDHHTLFSIIESDPSRSNRLQACSALEALLANSAAYLNIAEDRSTKASFTSLSAKLGETLNELHSSLSTLLSRPIIAGQADVHLALLSVAATLAANSPYGRLQRPLAWQLAKSCLSLLSTADPKVVSAAATALTSIVSRYAATASTAPFDFDQLPRAVEQLLAESPDDDSRQAGWALLAATVPVISSGDWTFATWLLKASFASSSIAVQEAQASFLVTLSRSTATVRNLHNLIDQALASPHDTARAIACTALTSPPAVRVLGLLAKSDGPATRNPAELRDAVPTLLSAVRGALSTSTETGREGEGIDGAMWALANCCDVLTKADFAAHMRDEILAAILDVLEGDTSGQQAVISAYRILASVLGASNVDDAGAAQLLPRAAKAAITGLTHPAAKVRWNAAIASAAILPRVQDDVLSIALFSTVVADSSYKVRIHASTALLSPAAAPGRLPQAALRLRPSLDRLVADLEDGRVPPKEKQHAEQLVKRLTGLCARLETA